MSRRASGGGVVHVSAVFALVGGALAFASPAKADETTRIAPPSQEPVEAIVGTEIAPGPDAFSVHHGTRSPNLVMIGAGVVTFGASYGMALVAAEVSTHHGDEHLFVPIVGPWLDLADRGSCGMARVTSCDLERGNKIGVAIDGVFQGIGVLAVAAGFVFPEKRQAITLAGVAAPSLRFAPVHYAHGGMGLAAIGVF